MANNEVKLKLSVDGAKAVLSDFDKVRSKMSGVSDAATTMGSMLKGMAAAFSVTAVTAWVRSVNNGVDALNDLKDATGASISNLSALEDIARRTGGTLDTVSTTLVKFNQILNTAKAGSGAELAIKAIGLSVVELKALDPAEALRQTAVALSGFADDGGKARIILELFGKTVKEVAPFLNDLAEKTALVGTVTAEEALEAEKLNKEFFNMSKNVTDLSRQMVGPLVSAFNKLIEKQRELKKEGKFGLFTTMQDMADRETRYQDGRYTGSWGNAVGNAGRGSVNPALVKPALADLPDTAALAAAARDAAKALAAQDKATAELLKTQIEAAKWNTKAVDELFDAQEKTRLQTEDKIKTARTTLEQIEFETALLSMNTEQRALATMERELEREGIVKGTLAYDAYIVKLREAMAIKTGKEAGIKAADDMREAQQKAAEESAKYWEDALMRAFESGKGFFQSLWDTIKNTLKTQVLRVLVSATGLTGMSAAGAGDLLGGGGGSSNLLSTAANLGKIYDTITSGFGALGDSVAFAAQDVGAWLVNNTSGVLNQAGSTLMQSAGTFGTVAGYAAGAAAGLAIGNAISGKYGSSGVVAAGTAIGSIFGGPIGGAIGGAIGGLVNRAFGRGPTELTGSGTRGTFSGTEFSGVNYANYKKDGGWFRSDKSWTDITAMNSATKDAWSTAFAGVKGSVASMAASLGLATDNILSYSKYIDVAAGTTQEQLTAIFTGMADAMALAAAPGLAAFAQTGESASTTLSRLGSSLDFANRWLRQFNDTLLATSLTGGDQASRLLDTFGGADQYASAQSAYYQVMYTDAQRLADTTLNVAKALALVNVAMPSTLDAYNALRNGLDLTTESGRNTYTVMTLLGPEFAQVAAAAQAAATESVKLMNDVFDTLENRLTGLIDSIASERAAVASASASVLGLQPKTAAQLAAEIAASKVALPSDANLLSALAAKSAAQTGVDSAKTTLQNAQNSQSATGSAYGGTLSTAQNNMASTVNYFKNLAASFQNRALDYAIRVNATGTNNDAYSYNASTNQLNPFNYTSDHTPSGRSYYHYLEDTQRFLNEMTANGVWPALQSGNTALANAAIAVAAAQAAYNNAMTAAAAVTTTASTAVATANATLAAADAAAKTALLAYADAMTQYSGDAEKAVKVLSQLREETVAYYEAQKELAGLMSTSAANLRAAVRNSQFGQLASGAALAQQQRDFATNYSLALATGGATKAGYADNLSAALPALTSALMDTSSTRSAWALATAKLYTQSETIAAQLDSAAAGMNYEAESLSLLGSIDVALGELDTNTAILKAAVDRGTDATAANLRVIATRLGGTPAFASGGTFSGGLRMVGERGPELEVTGPSRIFNAAQTRSLLQSGGAGGQDLVNELRALRAEVQGLRAEARATASNTNKTAKILGRVTQDGESISTTVLT